MKIGKLARASPNLCRYHTVINKRWCQKTGKADVILVFQIESNIKNDSPIKKAYNDKKNRKKCFFNK